MDSEDLTILAELVSEDAQVLPIDTVYGGQEVTLTEEEDIDYFIKIKGLSEQILIIKCDKFPAPKSIFKNSKRECKRADYIILTNTENKKTAVFLELKKGNPDNAELICQLKGAFCFLKYCQKIGQVFWEKPNFLAGYEYKFAVIKEIPKVNLKKKTTRIRHENLANRIKMKNIGIPEMPTCYFIFKHQEEIHLKKLLNNIS
ncbi:MAG: hypothetical protein HC799_12335 [Limnothrix sp. RL_2_0]|nr:hypothetical protein [Limnothrix sp. RL_2_0]